MSVMLSPWDQVAAEIEDAAQDDTLSAEARLQKLALYRDDLIDLLGRIDTYRGDLGLVQEGREPRYREAVLEAREDASLRALLIERGFASGSELDLLGYLSHSDLDKLDEEGLLESWLADSGRLEEGLWDAIKHPRGRGGRWTDVFGRIVAPKGRRGKTLARAPGAPAPGGEAADHLARGAHVLAGGKPGHVDAHLGDGQVRVRHDDGSNVTHRADDIRPHPDTLRPERFKVGDDLTRAALLIADGKAVELEQPHQVSTLLDRLASLAKEAREKGDKAPNWDLCKVSVKGTNLFCQQSQNIPRVKMPQLKGIPKPGTKADALPKDAKGKVDLAPAFRDHLREMGVNITKGDTRADHLRASQSELNGALTAHLMKQFEEGKREQQPLFTSKDDYVLDGHHRWAATVGADYRDGTADMTIPTEQVDMDIGSLIDEARRFTEDMGMPGQGADAQILTDAKRADALGMNDWPTPGPTAQKMLKGKANSQEMHSKVDAAGTRTYTPERQALHDKIIDVFLRERKPVVNPDTGDVEWHLDPMGAYLQPQDVQKVLMMAGGTASGKSTALGLPENAQMQPNSAVNVDPDEIKKLLPEFPVLLGEKDSFAASMVHEESSDIAKTLTAVAQQNKLNMIRDGTGNNKDPQKFAAQIKEMAAAGYEPSVFYVNAPTDEAITRGIKRAQETGRYVPIPEIRNQHRRVSAAFDAGVQPLIENGTIRQIRMYDTRGEKGTPPVLMAHGGSGSFTVAHNALFQEFLQKQHEEPPTNAVNPAAD